MLLVCPTCEASYQIDDSKIGSSGRTVRCKKCATVWFAAKPLPEPEVFTAIAAEDGPQEPAPASIPADETDSFPSGPDNDGWGDTIPDSLATTPGQPAPDVHAASGAESPDADTASPSAPVLDAEPAGGSEPIEHVAASSARIAKKGRGHGKVSGKRFAFGLPSGQGLKKSAPYAAFAACLLMVFAVAMREPLARSAPWTGKIFAAIGLPVAATPVAIANVRSELSKLDKADVLIVEGELTNRSGRSVAVPPVHISVRDESGTEIYSWFADVLKPTLQGGETSPFRARLASPPSNGRSVAVRFGQVPADSQDKAAPKKS